jgi:hypothetical protein
MLVDVGQERRIGTWLGMAYLFCSMDSYGVHLIIACLVARQVHGRLIRQGELDG